MSFVYNTDTNAIFPSTALDRNNGSVDAGGKGKKKTVVWRKQLRQEGKKIKQWEKKTEGSRAGVIHYGKR